MTAEQSAAFEAAMALPPAEREDLAHRLLETVDADFDQDEIDAAWNVEVAKRVDDIRSGKVTMMTWDEMKAKLEADRVARRG
jgi:putative addiction module component (TIGR02574 family)